MPRRNLFLLVVISVVSLICHQRAEKNRYGRIMVDAMEQIERRFVQPIERDPTDRVASKGQSPRRPGDPIREKDLFDGAMEGMVERLEDPYSTFIRSDSLQGFYETLDQAFAGVGIEVTLDSKTNQMTVTDPMVGRPAPAYEAGVRAGDRILRINGESTQGLSLTDAVNRMRGGLDTPVRLSILHANEQKPVEIIVHRKQIQVATVLGDTRNADNTWNYFLEGRDRIGYLRINTFAKETADELRQALDWLVEHDMRGLILDLRNDPGGFLDQAVKMCDLFINSGEIVTIRRRDAEQTVYASGRGTFTDFPIVALVNQDSASASEIMAACLQDHKRAVLVGQRTFGKGTIQEIIDLPGGQGALKLTTASYWRPSGKNIHRWKDASDDDDWGVKPNAGCQVVVEGEQLSRLRQWRRQRDVWRPGQSGNLPAEEIPLAVADPQLARAIQSIEQTAP